MTLLRPDTLAIQHLVVRGGPVAREQVAQLQREVEGADWPQAPGESWVFIRQLQVRGSAGQLGRELAQATRTRIQGGPTDNLMRFANLTELLAALLADLASGVAAERWYWQHWAQLFPLPVAQAITRLLAEHGEHLPAVCARLAEQRQLARVWLALDEAGAHQLAQELAWRSGFALPERHAAPTQQRGRTAVTTALRLPTSLPQRWQPVLRQLPVQDARHRLALLLIGQEAAPLLLQRAPATLLEQLAAMFAPAPPDSPRPAVAPTPPATRRAEPALSSSPAADPQQESTTASHEAEAGAHFDPAPSTPAQASPGSRPAHRDRLPADQAPTGRTQTPLRQSGPAPAATRPASQPDTETAIQPTATPAQPATAPATSAAGALASNLAGSSAPQTATSSPTPDSAFAGFHTRQGGLLYLLNFLNRAEAQSLLGDFGEELPGGWGWLYRLGQELQLDETDPIVTFLANQLGFEQADQLHQLPPLPAREQWLDLARRWYGRAGLWQPSLLNLHARIQASPSHVDLFAPLNAVQLPVRLAGLDINPGWLPWLGRVVTFHYE